MSTIFEVLQRAHLDQGIDLAIVAARTKIKAQYPQAIEDDDRKRLPGGFATMRVGNAVGLEVRLNGEPLGPLGAHDQVRDLVFTSDKIQFVSSHTQSE